MRLRFHRRRDDVPEDNPDRWLLTYADLITLLLAFFIVMYSMSRVDAKRFGQVSQALRGILKGGSSVLKINDLKTINTGHGIMKVGNLKMLQSKIHQQIEKIGRKGDIVTEVNERGLIIHIMESAMFDEASAELKPRAREILSLVAADVIDMPNHIRIEGHTDDRPINSKQFPTNWELSSSRATQVVRFFINNHGYPPDKISAVGFASYRPYIPNTSIENRARNRRVDIVVQTTELSSAEPRSMLNNFARDQIDLLRQMKREIDSPSERNNVPFQAN